MNCHHPGRIFVWQRAKEHRVNDAEDCGVRANTEGQCSDRHEGEARILAQHASGETNILKKCVDNRQSTTLAVHLFRCFHATEPDECLPPRFLFAHPRPQIILDVHLEISFDLRGKLLVVLPLAKHARQPRYVGAQLPHDGSSPGLRNRASIDVVFSHSRASLSSCFFPARVSL